MRCDDCRRTSANAHEVNTLTDDKSTSQWLSRCPTALMRASCLALLRVGVQALFLCKKFVEIGAGVIEVRVCLSLPHLNEKCKGKTYFIVHSVFILTRN